MTCRPQVTASIETVDRLKDKKTINFERPHLILYVQLVNQKNNLSQIKMSHVSYHNKGDYFSYTFSTLQFNNHYFLKLIERVTMWHDTNAKYRPTVTISCESNMDENQLLLSISLEKHIFILQTNIHAKKMKLAIKTFFFFFLEIITICY